MVWGGFRECVGCCWEAGRVLGWGLRVPGLKADEWNGAEALLGAAAAGYQPGRGVPGDVCVGVGVALRVSVQTVTEQSHLRL